MPVISPLDPPPRLGERLSLRLTGAHGASRDLVGFVTGLDPLTLQDRHGELHVADSAQIVAARRVSVSRGRDPRRTPIDLLNDLAGRAGADGEVWVARLSDLLDGREPPAAVRPVRGTWRAHHARVEGEWLTTDAIDPDALEALAWWAARQDARSVQVRARSVPALAPAAWTRLTPGREDS